MEAGPCQADLRVAMQLEGFERGEERAGIQLGEAKLVFESEAFRERADRKQE